MDHLHLLIAFEDGSLALFKFINNSWELMWRIRKHKDSIMSMCVSRDFRNAYTISVDKYVIKYYLQVCFLVFTLILFKSNCLIGHGK